MSIVRSLVESNEDDGGRNGKIDFGINILRLTEHFNRLNDQLHRSNSDLSRLRSQYRITASNLIRLESDLLNSSSIINSIHQQQQQQQQHHHHHHHHHHSDDHRRSILSEASPSSTELDDGPEVDISIRSQRLCNIQLSIIQRLEELRSGYLTENCEVSLGRCSNTRTGSNRSSLLIISEEAEVNGQNLAQLKNYHCSSTQNAYNKGDTSHHTKLLDSETLPGHSTSVRRQPSLKPLLLPTSVVSSPTSFQDQSFNTPRSDTNTTSNLQNSANINTNRSFDLSPSFSLSASPLLSSPSTSSRHSFISNQALSPSSSIRRTMFGPNSFGLSSSSSSSSSSSTSSPPPTNSTSSSPSNQGSQSQPLRKDFQRTASISYSTKGDSRSTGLARAYDQQPGGLSLRKLSLRSSVATMTIERKNSLAQMPMVKRNSLVIRPSDSSPHNRSRSLVNRIPARNNSLVNLPIRSNTTVRSSIRKLSLVDQTVARKNSFLEVSRLRMPNGRKENDYTELIGGDDVCTDEQEQDYRMYGLNKRHANSKTEGQQQQEKSVYVRTDDDEDDGDDDQMECVIDLESDLDELFYRVVDCAESFGIQQAELREIFS